MMRIINKKILTILLLLLVFASAGIIINKSTHHYKVVLINSKQGWGYDIICDYKITIHQPYMPVVSGQIAFGDKYQAKKTGHLVVKKLRNNQSPRITIDELNSIIKTQKKVSY